ncbi:MAG: hypothetical protein DHS80DRAFT_25966 [Piptocephalis tieghemiana]|nr:MAG: hypothetical protein DHS80DRAFT_25966 [Piptocephalis tieghemiana]
MTSLPPTSSLPPQAHPLPTPPSGQLPPAPLSEQLSLSPPTSSSNSPPPLSQAPSRANVTTLTPVKTSSNVTTTAPPTPLAVSGIQYSARDALARDSLARATLGRDLASVYTGVVSTSGTCSLPCQIFTGFLLVVLLSILIPVLGILLRPYLLRLSTGSISKKSREKVSREEIKEKGVRAPDSLHTSIVIPPDTTCDASPISLAQSSAISVPSRSPSASLSSTSPPPPLPPLPPRNKGDTCRRRGTTLEVFPELAPSIPFPDLGPSYLATSDLGSSDPSASEHQSSSSSSSSSYRRHLNLESSRESSIHALSDQGKSHEEALPSSSLESTDSWIARAYSDGPDGIYETHDASSAHSGSSHHLFPSVPPR